MLTTAAVVLTPLTALIVDYLANAEFSEWQIVVLIAGALGFLAIPASADVLARAKAIGKSQGGTTGRGTRRSGFGGHAPR